MNKREIKDDIAMRERIIKNAERDIVEIQQRIENNKKWVVELKAQLRDASKG